MANSADPDQKPTDLDLHSLQRQGISGVSRTGVNTCSFSMIGKNFNILKYFYFLQKTGLQEKIYQMPFSGKEKEEKKKRIIINFPSADFAQRVLKG